LRFDANASSREHLQRPSQSAGTCSQNHRVTSSNHIEAPATPQALRPRRERVTQHVLAAAPAPTLQPSARTGRRRHQVVAHDAFYDPEAAGVRRLPRRKLSWGCMHATHGARRSSPGAAVAGGRHHILPGSLPRASPSCPSALHTSASCFEAPWTWCMSVRAGTAGRPVPACAAPAAVIGRNPPTPPWPYPCALNMAKGHESVGQML